MKVKIIDGVHKNRNGVIVSAIPGGKYFRVRLDNGHLIALHEKEFERIPNNGIVHNEFKTNQQRSLS